MSLRIVDSNLFQIADPCVATPSPTANSPLGSSLLRIRSRDNTSRATLLTPYTRHQYYVKSSQDQELRQHMPPQSSLLVINIM